MAKLALKLRDQKRRKTVEKFKAKRARKRASSCRSCLATLRR
jgi:hypothetical protein